jgi:hypothetical protein
MTSAVDWLRIYLSTESINNIPAKSFIPNEIVPSLTSLFVSDNQYVGNKIAVNKELLNQAE